MEVQTTEQTWRLVASLVSVFIELNLCQLVALRCCPGQSFTNPIERVFSGVNLCIQNVSLDRDALVPDKTQEGHERDPERAVLRASSMQDLREHKPSLEEPYLRAVKRPCQVIESRIARGRLHDKQFQVVPPDTKEDVKYMQRHLLTFNPDMPVNKVCIFKY